MPELVRPVGHDDVLAGLVASARAGALPHALLFRGPAGIGKFRAARWLAATLTCERGESEPCLECGACTRALAGSHPDHFVVDAREHEQDEVTIFFVAERGERPQTAYQGQSIESFLALRAAEGRGKFVIIREADRMNEAAQNAFLKMLEEPRPGVHLILETARPRALLATVRSRVVDVRFEPLGAEDCASVVRATGAYDGDDAHLEALVRSASGSPGGALELHARGVPAMAELVARALGGAAPAHEVAAELWDQRGDFPGRTAFVQRRTRAETILDVGLELLTDVERSLAGVDESRLRHGRLARGLASSDRFEREGSRRRIADAWLGAREDLRLNLSPEGLVERALSAASTS